MDTSGGQAARATVVVLATGGTIAQAGSRQASVAGEDLLRAVPGIERIADLRTEQVFQLASPQITPRHWLRLAERVNATLSEEAVTGIVVTHGTDTLEETAYFLNLVARSRKPVVLTGAMRQSSAVSADGPRNILNAVTLAASQAAVDRGVLVTLNDRIDAAREVTKTHTAGVDAFRSPDFGPLGTVRDGAVAFARSMARPHTHATEFDLSTVQTLPKVGIVYAYAGVDRTACDAFVAAGFGGIVVAGTGGGSLAGDLEGAVEDARRRDVAVVRASRVGVGPVRRNGEADDDRLGLVTVDGQNPQKARVLLMLGLTRTRDPASLQAMFQKY